MRIPFGNDNEKGKSNSRSFASLRMTTKRSKGDSKRKSRSEGEELGWLE